MPVIVTMPDGTEKEFEDISSAKAYKKTLLADPNVGGALKLTGGDPEDASKFTSLQQQGQNIQKNKYEIEKARREVQGLSQADALDRGLANLEDELGKMPVGQKGPWAIAQGKWQKFKGSMGYEPMRSYERTRESLAVPLRRFLGDKGALSETDINTAVKQIPDIDDPMETRAALFNKIRLMGGLPPRHAIQAPQPAQGSDNIK